MLVMLFVADLLRNGLTISFEMSHVHISGRSDNRLKGITKTLGCTITLTTIQKIFCECILSMTE